MLWTGAAGAETFSTTATIAGAQNLGAKPLTKAERAQVAEYLYSDRDWSQRASPDSRTRAREQPRLILVLVPYKSPERQRAAKAESARRRRASGVEPRSGTLGPLLDGETRLRTARDVLVVIEGQVSAVLADDELGTAERARVASTLAGVALRAIEAGELAARVEALETVLKARAAA